MVLYLIESENTLRMNLTSGLMLLSESASNAALGNLVAQIIISSFISVIVFAISIFIFRAWISYTIIGIELVLLNIFYYFDLGMPFYITLAVFILSYLVLLFVNRNTVRAYLNDIISATTKNKADKKKSKREMTDDKFYHDITTAVQWLSNNKVGALITFEKESSLDKYISSGTELDSSIVPELIETIFYNGTRLHDGAMIIRDKKIIAASVFFPSTNRILVGKYGARHRAALGVSEVTDAVTVVVSEETGRISIAHRGILEAVKYDEFEKILRTFLAGSFSDVEGDDGNEEKGTEDNDVQ